MKLDLNDVRYSNIDIEKGIKIPKFLTPKLAEDLGIHIGDGSLYWCNKNKVSTEFFYSSDLQEEAYRRHILSLKQELYDLPNFRRYQKGNEIQIRFCSLAMATFYNKVFGFPIGKKSQIAKVPETILKSNDKDIISACLRGVVDTDFHFRIKSSNGYPQLCAGLSSKNLVEDLSFLLNKLKVKNTTRFNIKCFDKRFNRYNIKNLIYISGFERVGAYLTKIGFNNPKHFLKLKMGSR